MGGMLGYGYAGCHDDLAGLVTIGAPSDLGRGFFPLRLAATFGPALLGTLLDTLFSAARGVDTVRHGAARTLRRLRHLTFLANRLAAEGTAPRDLRFRHIPMDLLLRGLSHAATEGNLRRYEMLARHVTVMINPSRVTADDFQWLLREGGEKEPRKVVEQFARWIRDDQMQCYRTGYDYKAHFKDIEAPLAIIFGGLDKIASAESTRSVYRGARSEYLLWRPVKNNNHLELTMGYDLRQICEDIKNLVEYAARREQRPPERPGHPDDGVAIRALGNQTARAGDFFNSPLPRASFSLPACASFHSPGCGPRHLGAGARAGPAGGAARGEKSRIVSLRSRADSDASVVELVGDRPLSFTTLRLEAPPRVVLDFTDARLDGVQSELSVEDGTVPPRRRCSRRRPHRAGGHRAGGRGGVRRARARQSARRARASTRAFATVGRAGARDAGS